jgi:hypothetical protein
VLLLRSFGSPTKLVNTLLRRSDVPNDLLALLRLDVNLIGKSERSPKLALSYQQFDLQSPGPAEDFTLQRSKLRDNLIALVWPDVDLTGKVDRLIKSTL